MPKSPGIEPQTLHTQNQASGALLPPDDLERLRELGSYGILDTAPERAFDRITRLATRIFRTPIAAVNFIADQRQWLKSCVGLSLTETSREVSICAFAILSPDVMVIPDAREDPRFQTNPFVAGQGGVRFYAGAPLITPRGHQLGTLCVVDTKPRPEGLSEEEKSTLADLAAIVMDELELRTTDRQFRAVMDTIPALVSYVGLDARYRRANKAYGEWFGVDAADVRGRHLSEVIGQEQFERIRTHVEAALAGETRTFETLAPPQPTERSLNLTFAPDFDEAGRVKGFVVLAREITDQKRLEVTQRRKEARLRFLTELDDAMRPITDAHEITQSAARLMGE